MGCHPKGEKRSKNRPLIRSFSILLEETTVAKEPVSTLASTIHLVPVDGFSSTNGT